MRGLPGLPMGCACPVLLIPKWMTPLTPHHLEAPSPLGTGDGAPGTPGPRTVPGTGLLTPPHLCCVPGLGHVHK